MNGEMNQGQGRRLTPEEREIRIKKLKRKRRFRLTIVIVAFLLLISLIISPIVLFAAFRVKTFTLEGNSPYKEDEIIAASGIQIGKSLIFADLDEAAATIEKTLPYTDDVKLTKKLPSGIIIRYGETSKAFAIQVSGGMYALLNSELKVLELSAGLPEGVALISGAVPVNAEKGTVISFLEVDSEKSKKEEVKDNTLSLILEITGAIEEYGIKDINLIDISARSDIYLIYQERIVMRLGDSSDISSKLSLGQNVINQENTIDSSQYGTMNLTIVKKAYFNPSDPDDIKELVIYNGGEWEEKPVEIPEDNQSDENNSGADGSEDE